ncbi:MAG TPA: hypothetical protein VH595_22045 [Verrucomicrobiae bacterium]|jgi:hypothetical protein|nr:hypothetical protein [Verrucomicrobiae bacterium]
MTKYAQQLLDRKASAPAKRVPISSLPARTPDAPQAAPAAARQTPMRPLMDVPTAAFLLGCVVENIERDIDSGRFPVFDIRPPQSQRTLLRLYTPSVMAIRKGEVAKRPAKAEMLDHILPPLPHFSASRVGWLFHCCGTNITRLIETGEISAKEKVSTPGKPSRSWRIPRESLVAFLSNRSIFA